MIAISEKPAVFRRYRALVGDEWPDYLEQLHDLARLRWSYLVPDAPAERRRLRALCETTLAFENASYELMADHLRRLSETAAPAARDQAAQLLTKLRRS